MKKDKAAERKKKLMSVLAILLAIIMVLGIAAPFLGAMAYGAQAAAVEAVDPTAPQAGEDKEKVTSNKDFTLETKVGFDQKYIVGQTTPFRMVFANSGPDFKGEVQVKVYSYESDGYTGGEYSIYYTPIELAQGSSKEVNMDLMVDTIRKNFRIALVDESGKEVFSQLCYGMTAMDPQSVMVGILSENPQPLQYLNNLKMAVYNEEEIYNGVEYNACVYLNKDTLPDTKSLFDNFRMIIINDFSTKNLSSAQKEALFKWVEGGGMLVLGTGVNANKVLSGFYDTLEYNMPSDSETTVTSFPKLSAMLGEEIKGSLPVREIALEGMESVLEDSGEMLMGCLPYGNGTVVVHSYDLADPVFSQTPGIPGVMKELYLSISPSYFDIYYNGEYYSRNGYYGNLTNNIPVLGSSVLLLIFVIILLYILFIGPLLYRILKKRDKREKGWVIIPLCSVVVLVAIFGLSQFSAYKKSIINSVSVVSLKEGSSFGDAFVSVGMKSPQKGDVTFASDADIEIEMPSNDRYYSYNYARSREDICARRILVGDTAEITYYDNQKWGSNTFYTDLLYDMGGEVTGSVTINNNHFIGSFTNNTSVDFKDVVFSFGSRLVKYDAFPSGETIEVDYEMKELEQVNRYSDTYSEINKVFLGTSEDMSVRKFVSQNHLSNEDAYKLYQHMELMNYIMDGAYNYSYGIKEVPVKMYAFSEAGILPGEKTVNGKGVTELNTNVFVKSFDLDLSRSESFDIPFGFIPVSGVYTANGSKFDQSANIIYTIENGTVEFKYILSGDIRIDAVMFRWNDPYQVCGQKEIWNEKTQQWESLKEGEYPNAADYMDEFNQITVRGEAQSDQEIYVPQIRVKGGGR